MPHAIDAWPPVLPHPRIDELMTRQRNGDLEPWELQHLCLLIGDELQRVRSTVARLCGDRLDAARREAEQIVSDARAESQRPCPHPGCDEVHR